MRRSRGPERMGEGMPMTGTHDGRTHTWIALPLVTLAVVLVIGQVVGLRARRYSDGQRVHVVTSAAAGYAALRDDGAKGRIVVLLDERSRIVPTTWMAVFMESLSDGGVEPPVLPHNSTSALVYSGIARRVYFVPPSVLRDRELERLFARPDALVEGNGVRVRFNTVPVVLSRSADLPVFREKVVVWISGSMLEGYTDDFIGRITDPAIADVVVRVEDGS